MNKIEKMLDLLSEDERRLVRNLLFKINVRDFDGVDLKKLVGYGNIYRVKKSNIRIIFIMEDKEIFLLKIGRRKEDTYKNL